MGEVFPPDFENERDDLAAALDFSGPGPTADGAGFEVLGPHSTASEDPSDALEGEPPVPVFTVTNPPGTVTVTAFMDGRLKQIELSAKAAEMTEEDLVDEIVVIAGLATQDAKSAQYAFMLEGMRRQGHDDASTRDFLRRDLDLPTPEEAQAQRAQIFATRYVGEHD